MFGQTYASRIDDKSISDALAFIAYVIHEKSECVKKADIDAWYGVNKHIEQLQTPLSSLKKSQRSIKCNEANNRTAVEKYSMHEINIVLKNVRMLQHLHKYFDLTQRIEKYKLGPITSYSIQDALDFASYLKMKHFRAHQHFVDQSRDYGCNKRIAFDEKLEHVQYL